MKGRSTIKENSGIFGHVCGSNTLANVQALVKRVHSRKYHVDHNYIDSRPTDG